MQGLMREAFTWVAVAVVLTLVLLNFDEIRSFNARLAGFEPATVETTPRAAAYARLADETPRQKRHGDGVELRSDNRGHFEASAEINGRDISTLVDTGASMVVLTYEDAERAGIFVRPSDFTIGARTANGIARNAPVPLGKVCIDTISLDKVCIDTICVRDVSAMVSEPGKLHVTLLGMTFLSRLSRVDMRSGTLVLED